MSTLAEIFVKVRPDTKDLPSDLKRDVSKLDVSSATDKAGQKAGDGFAAGFGKSTKRLVGGAVAAIASKQVVDGLKGAVTTASDLAETQSKVTQVFGKSAGEIQKFASTADTALGQSKQAALDANATFGLFGKNAGLTGKELTGFTTKLTTLSSDLASFNNTSPEQAIEAIGAALRGESEPIRAYGVLLDDATLKAEAMRLGLVKTSKDSSKIEAASIRASLAQQKLNAAIREHGKGSTEAKAAQASLLTAQSSLKKATEGSIPPLTQQQKILAAQSQILKQTKTAQGDFARTSEGLANQQRIAAAQANTLKVAIGNALLPAVLAGAQGINKHLLPGLIDLAEKHGPKVAQVLGGIGPKIAASFAVLTTGDFNGKIRKALGGIEEDSGYITALLKIREGALGVKAAFDVLASGNYTATIFGQGEDSKTVDVLFKIREGIAGVGEKIKTMDTESLKEMFASLLDSAEKLAPVVQEFMNQMPGFGSVLNVGVDGLAFLADHADTLVKIMPLLVAAVLAYKVAQAAANIVQVFAVPAKVAEVVVNRQLVKSNKELIATRAGVIASTVGQTTATTVNTAATSANAAASGRGRIATIAFAAAQKAAAIASAVFSVAMKAAGVAVRFMLGPIGLIITGIALAAAGLVYAYKNSDEFKRVVDTAFKVVGKVASWLWNVILKPTLQGLGDFLVWAWGKAKTFGSTVKAAFEGIKEPAQAALAFVTDKFLGFIDFMLKGAAKAFGWVPGLGDKLKTASTEFSQFRDDVNNALKGVKDEAVTVTATYLKKSSTYQSTQQRPGSGQLGMARGGGVSGGIPGRDSVNALLMPGEHVLTTDDVKAMGGQGAVYDFRDKLHRFAKGGAVAFDLNTALPSAGAVKTVNSSIAKDIGREIGKQAAADFAADISGGPPGAVRSFRGKRLNSLTIRRLLNAERMLGAAFHITQGSYSTSVAASGGTHAGGGAMDTDGPRGWNRAVAALRKSGFAAWHRTPSQGPWGHHIHSIGIGDSSASPSAKRQVRDFLRGGDGFGSIPGRANGGIVARGSSYLVGERGPELLTMGQGGMVSPLRMTVGGAVEQFVGSTPRPPSFTEYLQHSYTELVKTLEKFTGAIGQTADRITDLQAKFRELAAATTSSFTGSLFGQGTSTADLGLRLQARKNDASGFQRNLAALKAKGLNAALWKELAGSSDYGAAQQLAGMSKAQIATLNKQYTAAGSAVTALGNFAGNTVYGQQIRNEQAILKRRQETVKDIQAALRGIKFQLTVRGNASTLAASNG